MDKILPKPGQIVYIKGPKVSFHYWSRERRSNIGKNVIVEEVINNGDVLCNGVFYFYGEYVFCKKGKIFHEK